MKPSHVCESASRIEYCVREHLVSMPIVEGRVTRHGDCLEVRCPYCGKRHLHNLQEGTRTAHCKDLEKGGLFSWLYYVRPRGARGPYLGYGEAGPLPQR